MDSSETLGLIALISSHTRSSVGCENLNRHDSGLEGDLSCVEVGLAWLVSQVVLATPLVRSALAVTVSSEVDLSGSPTSVSVIREESWNLRGRRDHVIWGSWDYIASAAGVTIVSTSKSEFVLDTELSGSVASERGLVRIVLKMAPEDSEVALRLSSCEQKSEHSH